jgi:NTP pyrophosphatase (non-canonical NTP hydrolase)
MNPQSNPSQPKNIRTKFGPQGDPTEAKHDAVLEGKIISAYCTLADALKWNRRRNPTFDQIDLDSIVDFAAASLRKASAFRERIIGRTVRNGDFASALAENDRLTKQILRLEKALLSTTNTSSYMHRMRTHPNPNPAVQELLEILRDITNEKFPNLGVPVPGPYSGTSQLELAQNDPVTLDRDDRDERMDPVLGEWERENSWGEGDEANWVLAWADAHEAVCAGEASEDNVDNGGSIEDEVPDQLDELESLRYQTSAQSTPDAEEDGTKVVIIDGLEVTVGENSTVEDVLESMQVPKHEETDIRKWEKWVSETATYFECGNGDITYPLLGLVGELGELVNSIVKYYRKSDLITLKTQHLPIELRQKLKDESYDALHFLMFLLNEQGISLSEIVSYGREKLEKRMEEGTVHKENRISGSLVGRVVNLTWRKAGVDSTMEAVIQMESITSVTLSYPMQEYLIGYPNIIGIELTDRVSKSRSYPLSIDARVSMSREDFYTLIK